MGKRNKIRKDDLETESNTEVEDSKPVDEHEPETSTKTKKQKKRKNKVSSENVTDNNDMKAAKSKKIKFDEDGDAIQDSQESSMSINKLDQDKTISEMKESDVKDEDIDQFCDEIDEEDNKQYENWIALLEEKLGGSETKVKNKKKVK